MATLSSPRLMDLLVAALPGSKVQNLDSQPKPAVLNVEDIGPVQIFLWTTTPDKSEQGRPAGEHKSQIIIHGSTKGSVQHFDFAVAPTFILGYSPTFGVFVGWEARLHQHAAYSKNLQVRDDLLDEASRDGWAVAEPRKTQNGPEVRVAFHPSHLKRYLQASITADTRQLSGDARRLFFLANAPDLDSFEVHAKATDGKEVTLEEIERERVKITGTRLKREASFSKNVLAQFNHQCAVCEIQLTIIDGAHIIPVHHPLSTDDIWNGLALCKNHHRLFDRRIMLIDGDAIVRSDDETVKVLSDLGRHSGFDVTVEVFLNKKLKQLPRFFDKDGALTARMKKALDTNYRFSSAK